MSIESSIDTYLRADSTLMTLLGGAVPPTLTTGRLYYLQAPEGASLPYAVYTMVSDTDVIEHFDKKNAGQGRVQIDVVASTKSGKAIEERIRTLLRYYHGTMDTLTVWLSEPAGRRESYNADTNRYVFSADYILHVEY